MTIGRAKFETSRAALKTRLADVIQTRGLRCCESPMEYRHLRVDRRDHAALSIRDDVETRVVVFTGAGKHFSAGADLKDPGDEYRVPFVLRRRRNRIGERVIRALTEMDQITIAAWNGGALGGGACLTTALDFRVGADDCFMQYPEIDIGMNLM